MLKDDKVSSLGFMIRNISRTILHPKKVRCRTVFIVVNEKKVSKSHRDLVLDWGNVQCRTRPSYFGILPCNNSINTLKDLQSNLLHTALQLQTINIQLKLQVLV